MHVCTVDRAFISRVSSELRGWSSGSTQIWLLSWWMTYGLYCTKNVNERAMGNVRQQAHMQTELKWEKWSYCCSCCRGRACPFAPGSWPALLLWTNTCSLPLLVAVPAAAAAGGFSSSFLGKRPSTRLGEFLWSYLLGSSEQLPWDLEDIHKLSVYCQKKEYEETMSLLRQKKLLGAGSVRIAAQIKSWMNLPARVALTSW